MTMMLAVVCRGSCYFCRGLQQQTKTATCTFVSSSSRWQRNYVMRTIHNSWITTLHTRSSKGNDDGTTSSTASCTTTVSSSKSHNRRYNVSPSVQHRIQNLISHPAVRWDDSSTFASMHGKKLKQRHLKLFDRTLNDDDNDNVVHYDNLFDQFAKAVCMAGVVGQKEIFETWASALYIYSSFLSSESINDGNNSSSKLQQIRRVVDVAGGHGLLAWALLLLDDEHQRRSNEVANENTESHNAQALTAFCLDVQMPKSAELIMEVMIQQWPHLEHRFDYVEGRLEQLVPHSSCLLASVHACGILSDMLVSTAADQDVPLALVPCCHSRKPIVLSVASPYAKALYDDIILNTKGSVPDLADRLDEARMIALENAGLDVKEAFLPTIFTGKNRLILGFPSNEQVKVKPYLTSASQDDDRDRIQKQPMRKGQMPPLDTASSIMPKPVFMRGFKVPCKDDTESRQIVPKLAGRAAAMSRKELMHNRHHRKSPQFDLSLWLPEDEHGSISGDAISQIVESKHNVKCSVEKLGSVYISSSGRRSQTFRIRYSGFDAMILSFEKAKAMQNKLYEQIPIVFPGAECR